MTVYEGSAEERLDRACAAMLVEVRLAKLNPSKDTPARLQAAQRAVAAARAVVDAERTPAVADVQPVADDRARSALLDAAYRGA